MRHIGPAGLGRAGRTDPGPETTVCGSPRASVGFRSRLHSDRRLSAGVQPSVVTDLSAVVCTRARFARSRVHNDQGARWASTQECPRGCAGQ